MMKKVLKNIALLTVAVLGAISCQKNEIGTENENIGGVVIYASAENESMSKITFEDKDSEGVALSWEKGDTFTLYNESGVRQGNFTCTDAASGKFENDFALDYDAKFYAIFPATETGKLEDARNIDISTQEYENINSLSKKCLMEGSFTYKEGEEISFDFEHQYAIMTVKFKASSKPTTLKFEDGDETYTVNFADEFEGSDGNYVTHIIIKPTASGVTSRTLKFTVGSDCYEDINSEKIYKKGHRYVADLTSMTPVATQLTLATVSDANISKYTNNWVITDEDETATTSTEFANLRAAINLMSANNCSITLEFPNLTTLASSALNNINSGDGKITNVSLPKVKTISSNAFSGSRAVENISAPVAESIGSDAFKDCTSLGSFTIAESVTSIFFNPFLGCSNIILTNNSSSFKYKGGVLYNSGMTTVIAGINNYLSETIELPESVTTIEGWAFKGVTTLKNITGSHVISLNSNAFEGSLVETATFDAAEVLGNDCFNGCSNLTTISIPAARELRDYCFKDCDNFKTLYLPAIEELYPECLSNTKIEMLTLGDSSTGKIIIHFPDQISNFIDSFSYLISLMLQCSELVFMDGGMTEYPATIDMQNNIITANNGERINFNSIYYIQNPTE